MICTNAQQVRQTPKNMRMLIWNENEMSSLKEIIKKNKSKSLIKTKFL